MGVYAMPMAGWPDLAPFANDPQRREEEADDASPSERRSRRRPATGVGPRPLRQGGITCRQVQSAEVHPSPPDAT